MITDASPNPPFYQGDWWGRAQRIPCWPYNPCTSIDYRKPDRRNRTATMREMGIIDYLFANDFPGPTRHFRLKYPIVDDHEQALRNRLLSGEHNIGFLF